MFRFAPRLLIHFACLAFAVLTVAQAQDVSVPVRAVISYQNLLDESLVTSLQQTTPDETELAKAIVNYHVADGTISQAVANSVHNAIISGVLPYEAFVIYLADVHNGPVSAPASLTAALDYLDESEVAYPPVDASGNVTETSLNAGLTGPSEEQVVGGSSDDSNEAITPVAGQ